jgi:hypothetical protein
MISQYHMLWATLLITASCSNETKIAESAPTHKPFSQRLNEKSGYTQDSEGNWKALGGKRSSFESQGASPHFQGEHRKSTYKTGEYAEKSWWGNKDYGRKKYDGNTDGSRFMTPSELDGKNAREGGTAAEIPDTYKTNKFATNEAREAGTRNISKTSDAETESRRRVFQQPEIIDWREQRSLSVEQSKGILGR